MKTSLILAIVGFVAVVCLSASAGAAEISIVNFGFEDPVLVEDDWTWLDTPGWTPVGDEGTGIWNTTITDFDPVIAPEGENVLYNEYTVGGAGGVAQVLTELFVANMDYTLTVEVGNSNYYYFSGYSVQLLAGGTVIKEDYDTLWPGYRKWATSTVAYTYDPLDSGLIGQPLEIRLLSLGLDKDSPPVDELIGVEFDNVTLTAISVGPPIPHMAWKPIPADGSRASATGSNGDGFYMLMTFTAGYGATTHTAYFSSNFDDVNDRNPAVRLGSPPYANQPGYETAYYAGFDDPCVPEFARVPLERGVTYYWVVDESNSVSGTVPGTVWSYTIAVESAWNPTPAHDAQYIDGAGVALSWEMGDIINPDDYAISYDVYWGTDEAAVAAGTSDTINVSDPTHIIGPLSGDADYYWKVDTLLADLIPPFDPTIVVEGVVWRFKTIVTVPIVDEDLIGWWKLDGDIAPGMAFDSSGYANHGTLMGDPTFVAGQVDNALDFDGNGDYVDCGNSTVLNSVTTSITVAAWIQVRTFDTTWQGILTKGDNSWRIHRGSDSDNINWAISGHDPLSITGATNVNDGEWHHVAGVYDAAGKVLYVDGHVDASDTATGAIPSPGTSYNVNIGANAQQTGRHWSGLIDDARIYKRALSAKEIKIIAGLTRASNPDPANGATDVSRTPTLNWSPGLFAAGVNGNELYFSSDRDAVANRSADKIPLTDSNYIVPTLLDMGETYYWAVDTANDPCNWPGDVWRFTTVDYFGVEDFESYVWDRQLGADANWVYYVWTDGLANFLYLPDMGGNETGANIFTRTDTVLGGLQGMRFDYNNNGFAENPRTGAQMPRLHKWSKAKADVNDLPSGIGAEWVSRGTRALSLWFYGDSLNDVEPMWVELGDGSGRTDTVTYGDYEGEEASHITEASWHEWFIILQDFNDGGIDLTDVNSIAIGFGIEGDEIGGGYGFVYFDDIRLYTPRCILSLRSPEYAKVDFAPVGAPDCVVNYEEVEIMAENWLGVVPIMVPVTVPDAGFDDHELTQGGYLAIADILYEGPWNSDIVDGNGGWIDYGYYRADGYPEDLYAHNGNNKAYGYLDYIYQILDETFIEGQTYTLSVWVGQPFDRYGYAWRLYFTGEDYTNNLIEASGAAASSWEQVSLVYTATAADAGNKIGIKMWGYDDVAFDDVTLFRSSEPLTGDPLVNLYEDMIINFKDFAVLGDRFLDEEMFP